MEGSEVAYSLPPAAGFGKHGINPQSILSSVGTLVDQLDYSVYREWFLSTTWDGLGCMRCLWWKASVSF